MDTIKKEFGNKLKLLRKANKYTQEQFAESIGINLRQLARIEAGESFVSSETLYKMCIALKVPPKFLFDFDLDEKFQSDNMNLNSIKDADLYNNKELKKIKNKLIEISNDKNKIEFINLAFNSLSNKKALKELKIVIKGIELAQK